MMAGQMAQLLLPSLSINVDVVGLVQLIRDEVKTAKNREGFVKNVRNRINYKLKEKLNIMVFNLNQEYSEQFLNVHFYDSCTYDGCYYGIWAFESGTFHNMGDGTYDTWAFAGNFTRHGFGGKQVNFKPRHA